MTSTAAALLLLTVAAFPLACYLAAKMGAVGWFMGKERVREYLRSKRKESKMNDSNPQP